MQTTALHNRTLRAMGLGLATTTGFAILTTIEIHLTGAFDLMNLRREVFWVSSIGVFVGGFSLAGWTLLIGPLTLVPRIDRLLGHPYFTEIVWVGLAEIAYLALVVSCAHGGAS